MASSELSPAYSPDTWSVLSGKSSGLVWCQPFWTAWEINALFPVCCLPCPGSACHTRKESLGGGEEMVHVGRHVCTIMADGPRPCKSLDLDQR